MDVRLFFIFLLQMGLSSCGVGVFAPATEESLDGQESKSPVEVKSVTMERVSERTMTVSWDVDELPDQFYLALGPSGGTVTCHNPTQILPGTQTEITISDLEHNTSYDAAVCAIVGGQAGTEVVQSHKTFPKCDTIASGTASFASFDSLMDTMADSNGDGIYALCLESGLTVTNDAGTCSPSLSPRSNTFVYANKGAYVQFINLCNNGAGNYTSIFYLQNTSGLSFENLVTSTVGGSSHAFNITSTGSAESITNINHTGTGGTTSRIIYVVGSVGVIRNVTGVATGNSHGGIYITGTVNLIEDVDIEITSSSTGIGITATSSAVINVIRNARITVNGTSTAFGISVGNSSSIGTIADSEIQVESTFSQISGIYLSTSSIGTIKNTTIKTTGRYAHGIYMYSTSHIDAMDGVILKRNSSASGDAAALLTIGPSYFETSAIKNVTACGLNGGDWTFDGGAYIADATTHTGTLTAPTTHTPRLSTETGAATFPFNDSTGGTAGTNQGIVFGGACP